MPWSCYDLQVISVTNMIAICMTGAAGKSLQAVASTLHGQGVSVASSISSRGQMDLSKWHDHVAEFNQPSNGPASTGGRMWEELAIDLMLANLEKPTWGWTHPFAVRLLDFWHQLDTSIRFLLVCQPRLSVVHDLVQPGSQAAHFQGADALDQAVAQWAQHHQSMLRFHLRNPEISHMVWAQEALQSPANLAETLNRKWALHLAADMVANTPDAAVSADTSSALIDHLADLVLTAYQEAQALELELYSTLGAPPSAQARAAAQPMDLLSCYRSLVHGVTQGVEQNSLLKSQAQAAQQELKESKEEAELLLMQLHQVQEELEKHFLQLQEKSKLFGQAEKNLVEVRGKLEAEVKAKAQTQASFDTEKKIKQELQAQLDELKKAKAELHSKLQAEVKAKESALAAREQQSTAKLNGELAAKNAELKEAKDEAELLLSQLHQVQEELEKYFLQHQEAQQAINKLNTRWTRAVQLHPALQAFEAIELVSEDPARGLQTWQVNQLTVAGQIVAPFVCTTFLEEGVLGLQFERQAGQHPAIRCWPQSAAQNKVLTLIPIKGSTDGKQRASSLLQMSAHDWQMLHQLLQSLQEALESGRCMPQATPVADLLAGIEGHVQRLRKVPDLVRFDQVELLGQRRTPELSVLALNLKSAWLNGVAAAEVKFQVQLNTSAGGMRSALVIFDHPNAAGVPFEQWHSTNVTAADEPVMAVELGPQGWGGQAWKRLSAQDRVWLQAILNALPVVWVRLQSQGVRLEGGWAPWVEAATQLRDWARVVTPEVTTPAKKRARATPPKVPVKPAAAKRARAPQKTSAKKRPAPAAVRSKKK